LCPLIERGKKREKSAPQRNFSENPYIYTFFVKALREGGRESNKMYRNKLAGHANQAMIHPGFQQITNFTV
jgi:hypothetical protein